MYVKAAKFCIERGEDYAPKEIERLQRMLKKVGIRHAFLSLFPPILNLEALLENSCSIKTSDPNIGTFFKKKNFLSGNSQFTHQRRMNSFLRRTS